MARVFARCGEGTGFAVHAWGGDWLCDACMGRGLALQCTHGEGTGFAVHAWGGDWLCSFKQCTHGSECAPRMHACPRRRCGAVHSRPTGNDAHSNHLL
eukprot:192265-Chlamydomonas_euryale.AAC.2